MIFFGNFKLPLSIFSKKLKFLFLDYEARKDEKPIWNGKWDTTA